MENRENQNPSTGSESDISKSQSQQQPSTSQDPQQRSDSEQSGDQAATGQSQSDQPDQSSSGQSDQSSTGQAGFGETATQQRSDIEGSSLDKKPADEAEGGFVGSEGKTDTSSELVEDEGEDFSKDGQGAPEGK
jgi:hypothetical protein